MHQSDFHVECGGKSMRTNHLGMAVAHLNAPFGKVVNTDHLRDALRAGSVKVIRDSSAAAVVSYAFVELDPRLISLCASESGADLRHADMLYRETLLQSLPRVPSWEKSVECLL